jgi:hypothetical protein
MTSYVSPVPLFLSLAERAILRAIGVPANLAGALPALATARHCLVQATQTSPHKVWDEWLTVSGLLQTKLREVAAQHPKVSLPAAGARTTADQFARLHRPPSPEAGHSHLASLLAHSIVGACGIASEVSISFIEGACTLSHIQAGQTRAHQSWKKLSENNLLNRKLLQEIAEDLTLANPAGTFAAAAARALELILVAPSFIEQQKNHPVEEAEDREIPRPGTAGNTSESSGGLNKNDTPANEEVLAPIDNIPTVAGRMVLADASPQSHKFGLDSRDSLPLEEFARITRLCAAELGTSGAQGVFAVLALVSAVTGATDAFALNLPFAPTTSIWIQQDCTSWCWDFNEYKYSPAMSNARPLQPVIVPLPQSLAHCLQKLRIQFPAAANLGELLAQRLGKDVPLEEFRIWLRSKEPSPHPAYRARFARSISIAWLQITGSDMGAAMGSCSFAASAPAALYYFGPRDTLQYERATQVFKKLGLGPPAAQALTGERVGCQKVLDAPALTEGWRQLAQDIDTYRLKLQGSNVADLPICNGLMVLVTSAFVVMTASRGSNLERLTFMSLYSHAEVIVVNDKDEGGRRTGRLLPRTDSVGYLLDICAWIHKQLAPSAIHAGHEPVAVQWQSAASDALVSTPVTTTQVAETLKKYFGNVDVNFARSAWVTNLDEAGCDRWLIRALTGHARDTTRTSSPAFDIPPLQFARKLRIEMERVGQIMFGSACVKTQPCCPTLQMQFPVLKQTDTAPRFMVEDTRTLLDDLEDKTLMGWRFVHRFRAAFVQGDIDSSAAVLAVLSLKVMDLLPTAQLCLDVVTDPQKFLRSYGSQPGVLWSRAHFTHPTWLPIDATTKRLLDLVAQDPPTSQSNLARLVNRKLADIEPGWPHEATTTGCFELDRAVRQFVRIEFPPSLAALMREDVPAPTLSHLSLQRLSGGDVSPVAAVGVPSPSLRQVHAPRSTTAGNLAWLRRKVAGFTSTDRKLGEARKRAVDLRTLIQEEFQPSTSYAAWIAAWVLDELNASAQQKPGALAITSLYTYLSVLASGLGTGDENIGDPMDWGDEEWLAWFDRLKKTTTSQDERLAEHVRSAVARLVRNLYKRGHFVSWEVRRHLIPDESPGKSGSASSTLILDSDFSTVERLAHKWLENEPLDLLIFQSRLLVHRRVPSRTGEVSSLRLNLLTQEGRLVFERAGFLLHKNDYAIRTVLLSAEVAEQLRSLRDALERSYLGKPQFLLRGIGDPAGSARDVRLLTMFSNALKLATGDVAAKPHSIRARTMQDMTWPDWIARVTEMMTLGISPAACAGWVSQLQTDPIRLVQACTVAGHSGLRAALGNYLAAWPLIMRLHVQALRVAIPPASGLVERLGVKKNTFAKAKSRTDTVTFCGWSWLHTTLRKANEELEPQSDRKALAAVAPHPQQRSTDQTTPQHAQLEKGICSHEPSETKRVRTEIAPPATPSSYLYSMAYLTARVLEIPKEQAMEFARIGLRDAGILDAILPADQEAQTLVRRARGGPGDRGRVGNQRLLMGQYPDLIDCGWQLLHLAHSITYGKALLACMTGAQTGIVMRQFDLSKLWTELAKDCPPSLSVQVRRAPRYLSRAELEQLQALAPILIFRPDREIGIQPVVSMGLRGRENRVVGSRATSVLRCALLARIAINESQGAIRGD